MKKYNFINKGLLFPLRIIGVYSLVQSDPTFSFVNYRTTCLSKTMSFLYIYVFIYFCLHGLRDVERAGLLSQMGKRRSGSCVNDYDAKWERRTDFLWSLMFLKGGVGTTFFLCLSTKEFIPVIGMREDACEILFLND